MQHPAEQSPEERSLLLLIQKGDQQAFTALLEAHQELIFGIAYKLTQSRPRAKEVVQDVFLKIWIRRAELCEVENLGAYLNRIARNQSIDALRQIAKEAIRHVELNEELLECGESTTEDTLRYQEAGRMLSQAMETLSPQQRKVYELCHGQGLKYEEAAQVLGLSTGTVHAHMKQALRKIRIYLKNMDAMLLLLLLMQK